MEEKYRYHKEDKKEYYVKHDKDEDIYLGCSNISCMGPTPSVHKKEIIRSNDSLDQMLDLVEKQPDIEGAIRSLDKIGVNDYYKIMSDNSSGFKLIKIRILTEDENSHAIYIVANITSFGRGLEDDPYSMGGGGKIFLATIGVIPYKNNFWNSSLYLIPLSGGEKEQLVKLQKRVRREKNVNSFRYLLRDYL